MSAQPGIASVDFGSARAAAVAEGTGARVRLASVDVLRGLVMMLMVLDHTRDYFGLRINPVDLSQTTEAIFLTLLVTHLCAPTFIFLSGVGACLMSRRMTRGELSRFLIKRGLWLVVLELTYINVQKYPPSLQFLLVTLGAAFLLLAAFESAHGKVAGVLRTFGQVPLFFFLLHIPLLHFGAGLVGWAMGFGDQVMVNSFPGMPAEWGFGLPVVYTAWALALLILYPACKWFGDVKRRRKDWWLAYL